MKVGMVCPYAFDFSGGVQNHVLGLASWLITQGHQVKIIGPGTLAASTREAYGLTEDIFTSSGRSFPISINRSVAHINLGFTPMRILRSWLSNEDFDVVHVHEPFTPTISLSALKHSTKPTIATFHAETPHGWLLRLVKTFVPWAVKRLDAGIAVSKAALGVADSYLDITPVIIGNGIAINNFPPLSATTTRWRGGDRPRLVFVGRYDEPRKGFSVLIQALPIIRENVADLDVVVVGNGSMPNISGVRFIPKASDDDRNSWLATADVYIAPNTGRESFGIVLLEALACGAPVVASDLPAFVEVLSDDEGIVGRTFRVGDAHAAARAVIDALGEARDLHCERGRSRASCFDWDVIGPQIVDHYRLAGRHHHHL